jgi:purine nucleosidase
MTDRELVLLDTDIGSNVDDAVALAYLLRQPRCELLGVTTVSGEAEARARIASAICHAAGRPDVPVYPGAEQPLVVSQRQPFAPQAAYLEGLPHATAFSEGEAVDFLLRTIRAHPGEVTLLAIGPLTNAALLFEADPALPGLLKRLVFMAGAYASHGHRGLDADWNIHCDPQAAAAVFSARVPVHRSLPLDVTLKLRLSAEDAQSRFDSGVLAAIRQLDAEALAQSKPVYFHDPLTAASIFDAQLCRFRRGRVEVALEGRTSWTPDVDGPHEVAFEVDVDRFFREHLSLIG